MAQGLGDIFFGLGVDTTGLDKAVRAIQKFGEWTDTLANSAKDTDQAYVSSMQRIEKSIISAGVALNTFQQNAGKVGAPAALAQQAGAAFQTYTLGVTKLGTSSYDFNRANLSLLASMTNLRGQLAGFAADANSTLTPMQTFTNQLHQMAQGASLFTGPLSGVSSRLLIFSNLLQNGVVQMALTVAGVAAATYGFYKLSEASIHNEEGLLRTRLQLRGLYGDSVQTQLAMKTLMDIANQFGAPFEDVAQHFARIELATRGTRLEGSATISMFKDLIAYTTNMGKTEQDLDKVLNQVSQSLARRHIQLRDLRAIESVYPGATLDNAAAAMNKSTSGFELALQRGQIIASEFWPKFISYMNQINGISAGTTVDNLLASQGRLANAQTNVINAFNQAVGISDTYKASLDSLSRAFTWVATNMTTIIPLIGAIGGAFLGAFAGPMLLNALVRIPEYLYAIGRGIMFITAAMAANPFGQVIRLTLAVLGAVLAWDVFNQSIDKSKTNLIGTVPTMDEYLKHMDDMKKKTSDFALEVLNSGKARLLDAQATLQQLRAQSALATGGTGKAGGIGSDQASAEAAGKQTGIWYYIGLLAGLGEAANKAQEGALGAPIGPDPKVLKAAEDEVRKLADQVDQMTVAVNKARSAEAAHRDSMLLDNAALTRLKLLYKDMEQAISFANREIVGMQAGPAELQKAMEQLAIDKVIEQWADKFFRVHEKTDQLIKDFMNLQLVLKKLDDMKIFDKNFVSLGQFITESFKGIATGGIGKFIDALNAGNLKTIQFKDIVIDALGAVEKKILELGVLNPILNNLFGTTEKTFSLYGGGTATGGLFGKFLSSIGLQPASSGGSGSPITSVMQPGTGGMMVPTAHGGTSAMAWRAFVDPSIFLGAPRLHSGLAADEYPAILQQGEEVTAKGKSRSGGTVVNVHNYAQDTRTETKQSSQGGVDITDVIISTVNKGISQNKLSKPLQSKFSMQQPVIQR